MPRRSVPKRWPTGMIEVAPNVYGYVQGGGVTGVSNGGLIVGNDGAIAVDALFVPSMTKRYLRAIRKATKKPVSHLINTHHHIDHIGGNQFFPRSEIVAHVNCREEMIRFGIPLKRLQRFMPDLAAEMADEAYVQELDASDLTPARLRDVEQVMHIVAAALNELDVGGQRSPVQVVRLGNRPSPFGEALREPLIRQREDHTPR